MLKQLMALVALLTLSTSAFAQDYDCPAQYPGIPTVPLGEICPNGSIPPLSCRRAAEDQHRLDWEANVKPLIEEACDLKDDIERYQDLVWIYEDDCEAGIQSACRNMANAQTKLDNATLGLSIVEGTLAAAQGTLYDDYLAALQNCCEDDSSEAMLMASTTTQGDSYDHINPYDPPNYLIKHMLEECGLPAAPPGYHYEWDKDCLAATLPGGPAYIDALANYFACVDAVFAQYQQVNNDLWEAYQTAKRVYNMILAIGTTAEIEAARTAMLAALAAYQASYQASADALLQCELTLMTRFDLCDCIITVAGPGEQPYGN